MALRVGHGLLPCLGWIFAFSSGSKEVEDSLLLSGSSRGWRGGWELLLLPDGGGGCPGLGWPKGDLFLPFMSVPLHGGAEGARVY